MIDALACWESGGGGRGGRHDDHRIRRWGFGGGALACRSQRATC
jgi:hypothetical protein